MPEFHCVGSAFLDFLHQICLGPNIGNEEINDSASKEPSLLFYGHFVKLYLSLLNNYAIFSVFMLLLKGKCS